MECEDAGMKCDPEMEYEKPEGADSVFLGGGEERRTTAVLEDSGIVMIAFSQGHTLPCENTCTRLGMPNVHIPVWCVCVCAPVF